MPLTFRTSVENGGYVNNAPKTTDDTDRSKQPNTPISHLYAAGRIIRSQFSCATSANVPEYDCIAKVHHDLQETMSTLHETVTKINQTHDSEGQQRTLQLKFDAQKHLEAIQNVIRKFQGRGFNSIKADECLSGDKLHGQAKKYHEAMKAMHFMVQKFEKRLGEYSNLQGLEEKDRASAVAKLLADSKDDLSEALEAVTKNIPTPSRNLLKKLAVTLTIGVIGIAISCIPGLAFITARFLSALVGTAGFGLGIYYGYADRNKTSWDALREEAESLSQSLQEIEEYESNEELRRNGETTKELADVIVDIAKVVSDEHEELSRRGAEISQLRTSLEVYQADGNARIDARIDALQKLVEDRNARCQRHEETIDTLAARVQSLQSQLETLSLAKSKASQPQESFYTYVARSAMPFC